MQNCYISDLTARCFGSGVCPHNLFIFPHTKDNSKHRRYSLLNTCQAISFREKSKETNNQANRGESLNWQSC